MDTGSTAPIREAIAREDYAGAQRLWNEYAGGLRQAVLDRVASPEQLAEARELIEWAKLSITALRAHAADQLGRIHAASVYARASEPSSSWLQSRF